jgi:hypothetical protein
MRAQNDDMQNESTRAHGIVLPINAPRMNESPKYK